MLSGLGGVQFVPHLKVVEIYINLRYVEDAAAILVTKEATENEKED